MIHENGRITSPAKISSDSVAASTVACVRTERGSVSLIERLSTSCSDSLRCLLQVLADAIEDDDRVVERVTDHGEERRDDGERNLEVHHREERERREDVVRRGEDGGDAEAPLEAEGEVDQRDEERDEDRDDRLASSARRRRAHRRLGACRPVAVVRRSVCCEHALTICCAGAVGARGAAAAPRLAAELDVVARRAERRDLGAREAGRVDRRRERRRPSRRAL